MGRLSNEVREKRIQFAKELLTQGLPIRAVAKQAKLKAITVQGIWRQVTPNEVPNLAPVDRGAIQEDAYTMIKCVLDLKVMTAEKKIEQIRDLLKAWQ